ncbi:hypothetical protein HYC85_013381 [Camellia sinensis]|uniref:Exportin-1 C-terminal domain-containing protein n=1 Tax=Camellia sinensis TaxID=4442 RepID=A0A7J7H6E6_CAMSI|nr:hypothetical protein HYC85_013381 [Camellia sinensis]
MDRKIRIGILITMFISLMVAALNFGDFYNMQYVKMYNIFMVQLQAILPSSTNIPDAYAAGTSDEQSHIRVLESSQENISVLLLGLEYLINISYVDDTEVFKVCLDYWNSLVLELFEAHHNLDNPAAIANMMGLQMPFPGIVDGLGSQLVQRRQLYAGPMSKLRLLMVCRMAKPEEVLIVEDENGNIVRETMKDNDVLVQYKWEVLISVEGMMLKKLNKQLSGEDWTWNNLNTLCWAIGSISGSMMEEQENRFLVMVIRDLLNLCEITKGKDNKAVIASNIMYVVGQYPRFLRAHWKFLKTVVNKLFEFMHETHPGVQDMACDTFLKIVQKCKRKFVIVQLGESEPFVSELLTSLPTTIADLEPHQIHSFYESKWVEIIAQARHSVDFLKDQDVIRTVLNILQIFEHNNVKRETLKLIETFLDKAEDQPQIGKQFVPPMMDPVLGDYARNLPDARESEVLSLFATIINKYKGAMIEDVPRIFEAVFQCTLEVKLTPEAKREQTALIFEKKALFHVWTVSNATRHMITKNFEDYPEHRLKFFSLLRAIATHCFPALIRLSSQQLKLVMDSIIWAFRHTERNIAETGLNLLLEMLKNFQTSEFCNQFYRTYFVTIEQEIFAVLTDTFHKPGFKLHVLVLQHLFCLAESGSLTEPLWDVTTVTYPYPNNAMFVAQFVSGLFESRNDLSTFKDHIRDFLVQSKEFSAQDNKDLYAEEAAAQKERERQRMLTIPGLIAPNEIQDEMDWSCNGVMVDTLHGQRFEAWGKMGPECGITARIHNFLLRPLRFLIAVVLTHRRPFRWRFCRTRLGSSHHGTILLRAEWGRDTLSGSSSMGLEVRGLMRGLVGGVHDSGSIQSPNRLQMKIRDLVLRSERSLIQSLLDLRSLLMKFLLLPQKMVLVWVDCCLPFLWKEKEKISES